MKSKVVRVMAAAASTGWPDCAAFHRSTCRSAMAAKSGTKDNIVSCRKIGAAARRCHRHSLPSATKIEFSPTTGLKERRVAGSRPKASAFSTRISPITSGSQTKRTSE
jgi:hypothetical protein